MCSIVRVIGQKMRETRWAYNTLEWKPTPKQWKHASACISYEESERVHKFVFKEDAKLALVGRLLIRQCITQYLQIPWDRIQLDRTEKGKPYLVNGGQSFLSFNVSHQGSYSVLAASDKDNVGVDVMKIERPANSSLSNFFNLMTRQFTEEEWRTIKRKSSEFEQMSDFYRFWCLKESYLKAIGTGLGTNSARFMRFEVFTDKLYTRMPTTSSVLHVNGYETDWKFEESLLDEKHVVTVARHSESQRTKPFAQHESSPEFQVLTFDELTANSVPLRDLSDEHWTNFSQKKQKFVT